MNHGTADTYELLFPRTDTGSDNRIEAGKEYVVPATQGWFRIAGPAGQDHDVLAGQPGGAAARVSAPASASAARPESAVVHAPAVR